ncbi:MAG: sugar phosphate nucleotidyltransferase [Pseudomonadota bacterium]|nr:sugar phosphate nucleotidyltransferase [Pseudomonadota bacterium]
MSSVKPLLLSEWRAMILAAGFGTRLKPLTERLPKPLVPVAGLPMLALSLNRLRRLKPRMLVVNGHHLSTQLETFLEQSAYGFQQTEYLYEPLILDTGGAIRNASRYLRGPFFVTTNADVVSDISLLEAVTQHLKRRSLVTMLLHDRERYNQVEVDCRGRIRGFGRSRPASGSRILAYTGIQICSPLLLDLMAREPSGRPFSLITFYRRLLAAGRLDIISHVVDTQDNYYWRDVGTPDDLVAIEHDLVHNPGLAARLGIV